MRTPSGCQSFRHVLPRAIKRSSAHRPCAAFLDSIWYWRLEQGRRLADSRSSSDYPFRQLAFGPYPGRKQIHCISPRRRNLGGAPSQLATHRDAPARLVTRIHCSARLFFLLSVEHLLLLLFLLSFDSASTLQPSVFRRPPSYSVRTSPSSSRPSLDEHPIRTTLPPRNLLLLFFRRLSADQNRSQRSLLLVLHSGLDIRPCPRRRMERRKCPWSARWSMSRCPWRPRRRCRIS